MFSSEQAVMQASREDLQTIEGIGEKTSSRIRWAISERMVPYGDETEFPMSS